MLKAAQCSCTCHAQQHVRNDPASQPACPPARPPARSTFSLNRERAVDYLNHLERLYVCDG